MRAQLAASLSKADLIYCYAGSIGWNPADDLAALGERAHVATDLDRLVARIVADARHGDRILVMSNGGFGGIHGRLLAALEARGDA
jgi:UDP-N-acetylmuramate: L-alanyl-gamma-D-glutamyl-meso-diaminopimelate ligase